MPVNTDEHVEVKDEESRPSEPKIVDARQKRATRASASEGGQVTQKEARTKRGRLKPEATPPEQASERPPREGRKGKRREGRGEKEGEKAMGKRESRGGGAKKEREEGRGQKEAEPQEQRGSQRRPQRSKRSR